MTEQALEAGERRHAADGDLLALSPKPVKTGALASDAKNWIRRKNATWMDLQGGDLLMAAEFSLMFLSCGLLLMATGFAMTLSKLFAQGIWDLDPIVVMLACNIFGTLPFGLVPHLMTNHAIKNDAPVRLNRQKRAVAIPHWVGGSSFKYPLWGMSTFIVIYLFYMFGILCWLATWWDNDPYHPVVVKVREVIVIALGISLFTLVPYLVTGIVLKVRSQPRLTYLFYPWEQLVVFIQKQEVTAPTMLASASHLTLAVPDPDNPETAKAAAVINVGHETVGLAQWECIRAYMDEGPESCPDPRDYETLAAYKARCRQARQELSTGAWLWKKVKDLLFQRYLAHVITERRVRKLMPKAIPDELEAWSESLPEAEWARPTDELTELNRRLTDAYHRGAKFTQMGPVERWLAEPPANARGHVTA